jgi:hypothetical protein
VTIRPKSQQNLLCKPQRLSGLSLGIAAALMSLAGASQAAEINLENGWSGSLNTTVSVGTSIRAQAPDSKLYRYKDASTTVIATSPDGTGGSNTDSGNANFGKGDAFSTLFKVSSDLSLSKGEAGLFVRVKAWYDQALKNSSVEIGNHSNGWVPNSKLSDSGFEPLQKFSGVALLDAYAYNTYEADGKPLQVRVGNQVINWGESLFIQGLNQVNPIDLSALRKPGAEVKDAFLPITSLSANLGLGGGKSLEAFYQLAWQPSNIDSCGTYFGVVETQLSTSAGGACSRVLTNLTVVTTSLAALTAATASATGQTALSLGNSLSNRTAFDRLLYVPMANGRDGSDSGQFGVALRIPSETLDTEFGVFAMQINSRTPVVSGVTGSNLVTAGFGGVPRNGPQLVTALNLVPGKGLWEYPDDIRIYGVSASKNIAGWSVGAELSHTGDQPAQINANDLLLALLTGTGPMGSTAQAAITQGGLVGGVEVPGYDRVKKTQLQVNGIKVLPRMLGAAQSIFVGEVAVQHTDLPDSNTGLRYGRAFIFGQAQHSTLGGAATSCATLGNDQVDGCVNDGFATDNSWGYRLRLGMEYPNWAGTSATFYPTISFSHDVKGYSVDNQFIEDRQTLGLSGRWNINKVHNVEVSYVRYGDEAKYDPFRDRDFYSLVLSTTF